ncbi:hypothetical protein FACS1894191_0600 [Clostridia bacterium]|nr:hypothetical protein FACS1894191_0600 [Clostridia bacterium]
MQPTEQAREDMILELCALAGDFPVSLLDCLSGSKEWSKQTVARLVQQDKLIRRYKHDNIKSLRLTKKGRDLLLRVNRERFCNLLEGAGATRIRQTDLPRRLRFHSMAAVFLMMLDTGVTVHRDEKADIFGKDYWERGPTSVLKQWSPPCFYISLEIKQQGYETLRIRNTRTAGVLFTEALSPYLVYNTCAAPIRWSSISEQKMSGIIEGTLRGWKLPVSDPAGLMFGDSMDTLFRLINSGGGIKRRSYYVDGTFPDFYFVPISEDGKLMLRLLCSEQARQRIAGRLSVGLTKPRYTKYVLDAVLDGKSVLFAWDLNMVRLKYFREGLQYEQDKGIVFCMDFQAPALKSLFGELAEIRVIGRDIFAKELRDGS